MSFFLPIVVFESNYICNLLLCMIFSILYFVSQARNTLIMIANICFGYYFFSKYMTSMVKSCFIAHKSVRQRIVFHMILIRNFHLVYH